jgi:hypothetical protein
VDVPRLKGPGQIDAAELVQHGGPLPYAAQELRKAVEVELNLPAFRRLSAGAEDAVLGRDDLEAHTG